MSICYIIGAGDIYPSDIVPQDEDFIICADGGYRYEALLGRKADLVVGDFDSLGEIPDTENRIVAPCEKDETDMMLAVNEGLKRGYKSFVLFGALGGSRFDHTVANLQLLSYICNSGARATVIHGTTVLTAFSDGEILLPDTLKGYVSVFSLCDESKAVTIENLKYTLKDAVLKNSAPLGVSNEFIGKQSRISVGKGTLLVVYNR